MNKTQKAAIAATAVLTIGYGTLVAVLMRNGQYVGTIAVLELFAIGVVILAAIYYEQQTEPKWKNTH